MDIEMLTRFLMWCTFLNVGLLVLASLMMAFVGDFVYRVQSRWFPMSRQTFNVVLYSFIGMYKIVVFVFNVIPWLALLIIG